MEFKELAGDLRIAVHVGATAAGTALQVPIMSFPTRAKLAAVYWTPGAAITAHATNFFSLGILNRGSVDGSGTTAMVTARSYAATDGVAGKRETLTVHATEANLLIAADDVVAAVFTHAAAGLAIPAGLVELVYRHR